MESPARLNRLGWGLIAGVIGTCIGFLLLAGWWSAANGQTIGYFVNEIFIGSDLYKDSILTVSVLFNVGVFYLSLQRDMYRFARGLMMTMILSVILIICLQATSAFGS